jgi:hypothetical protein
MRLIVSISSKISRCGNNPLRLPIVNAPVLNLLRNKSPITANSNHDVENV